MLEEKIVEALRHDKPWGRGVIYNELVLPIIRSAASIVGISGVYIFSIDEDRLIETYRSHGFRSLSDEQERSLHTRLEPRSVQGCRFMYMRAWAETSSDAVIAFPVTGKCREAARNSHTVKV